MVLSTSIIATDIADTIITQLISQNLQFRIHSADPGVGGTANEVNSLQRAIITPSGWSAITDDPIMSFYGGRVSTATSPTQFGTATTSGAAEWVSVWREGTPGSGTFNVWRMNIKLLERLVYAQGDPVYIPGGLLVIFASGADMSQVMA